MSYGHSDGGWANADQRESISTEPRYLSVKQLRLALGYGLRKFAGGVGIQVSAYADIEQGREQLTEADARKIAAALNAEPAGLTGRQRELIQEEVAKQRQVEAFYRSEADGCGSHNEHYHAMRDVERNAREDAEALESLLAARSAPADETEERKPVPITEGPCNKGGQNPPSTSDARPPAPGGSGGCRVWPWKLSPEEVKAIHDGPTAEAEAADDTVTVSRAYVEYTQGLLVQRQNRMSESPLPYKHGIRGIRRLIAEAEATLGEEGNDGN